MWVVARKDLDDAIASRFLMATVILLPFVFAVIIPVATLIPISYLPSQTAPLSVSVGGPTVYQGVVLENVLIENATIDHCHLANVSLDHVFVGNSTFNTSYAINSVLWNVTLNNSVVKDSNLYDSHVDAKSSLLGSIEIGKPSELTTAANAILGLYLVFFVLIPVIVPAVMASNTILGEKTNKSLEPLLASPVSSSELLTGKTLAIFLPTVLTTWGSFAAFAVIVSAVLDRLTGSSSVPNPTWYLTIFVVAPLVALLSIGLNVIVSSRVTDVRVGQQLSTLVIFPILLFFLGGILGVFALGPLPILALAGGLAVAAFLVLALSVRLFDRETVLLRWK